MNYSISVIVFDLGNVLLPFDYQILANNLERIEKDLGKNFLRFLKDNYPYHRAFERGDVSEDVFIQKMLSALNYKIDREIFCKYYSEIFSENIEVVKLLPELKKNFILVLLSNTNLIHDKYGWRHYEFLRYFDKLVLSYKERSVNPEEKIYRAVESFTMKNHEEHFFIDDVAEYIEAARALGWKGVQFKGYTELRSELINRGILN